MTIVAFLQNLWVKDPDKVKQLMERYPDQRNIILRSLLFMGGLTGKRIKQAFGEELSMRIIWEECTKEIAGDSKTICEADYDHIEEVIEKFNPDIVITFGKIAYDALCFVTIPPVRKNIIKCPHPASRQKDILEKLKLVAEEINKIIQ